MDRSPSNSVHRICFHVGDSDEEGCEARGSASAPAPTGSADPAPVSVSLRSDAVTLSWVDLVKKLDTTAVAPTTGFFAPVVKRAPDTGDNIKTLLAGCSGTVKPGQILALMGPSGSGKTTLLNCLGGRSPSLLTGSVLLNGVPWRKDFKHRVAYVLQQDTFFQHQSPRDQLTFTALLRLGGPAYPTRASKLAVVDKMIALLSLTKCQHTPIMFLSGGERKRVNIGTELLTDPPLLLLDEPLSGLDASGANSLMKTLRDLANAGMTIICSIHAPSSALFHSFDLLYLVADGVAVFSGPPSNAVAHFGALGFHLPTGYSIADYILDVCNDADSKKTLIEAAERNKEQSGGDGRSYAALTASSASGLDTASGSARVSSSKWATGFFEQFVVLYKRSFHKSRGEIFTNLAIKQCLALAIITGLFWLQIENNEKSLPDRSSFVFFALTFWPMNVLFTSLMSFPLEHAVISKERASGTYRLSAFYLAKSAASAPLILVLPVVFLTISYWMSGINSSFSMFLGFLISELIAVLAAESIGVFLGAAIPDLMKAITVATVTLLSLMLAGGFFVQRLPTWLRWIKYLSIFHYAFAAAQRFTYGGDNTYRCDGSRFIDACAQFDTTGLGPDRFTGDDALQFLGVDGSIGFNLGILLAVWIGIRILGYIVLRTQKIAER